MVEVRQRDNMFVGFDDNHLPLVISTFRGPLDLDDARWHDEISSRTIAQSLSEGRRILHVIDARDVDVPSAQLRKFWAERISQSVATIESMLGVFVVIDKPILRGVLTAINWICKEARRVEYFPTLSDALNLANVRFSAAGYPLIAMDATGYRVPLQSISALQSTGSRGSSPPRQSSPPRESYQAPRESSPPRESYQAPRESSPPRESYQAPINRRTVPPMALAPARGSK